MQYMALRERGADIEAGSGRPRLVFTLSGRDTEAEGPAGQGQREFALTTATTTIGSGPCDLRLDGLGDAQAEIRHNRDDDDYTLVGLGPVGTVSVNGLPAGEIELHNGDRLMIGSWTLTFQREESSDHGRYEGGRSGGELSGRSHEA